MVPNWLGVWVIMGFGWGVYIGALYKVYIPYILEAL